MNYYKMYCIEYKEIMCTHNMTTPSILLCGQSGRQKITNIVLQGEYHGLPFLHTDYDFYDYDKHYC